MPFFWNDKTYWKRYKASSRIEFKVFLPMLIISFLLWGIFINRDIEFMHLVLVSILSAGVPYTFISIFLQFPNAKIPDTYSPFGKKLMYIGQFLAACFGLYIIVTKVIFV